MRLLGIINKLGTTGLFDPRLSNLVYDNTSDRSPLRKLLCDIYVWCANESWFDDAAVGGTFNGDLAIEVSQRYASFFSGQRPAEAPFFRSGRECAYHSHGDRPCYRLAL